MPVSPTRVNHIFRSMLIAVWVDCKDWKIVGYTPRNWSVSMFPHDKVRLVPLGNGSAKLASDALYPDTGGNPLRRAKSKKNSKNDDDGDGLGGQGTPAFPGSHFNK